MVSTLRVVGEHFSVAHPSHGQVDLDKKENWLREVNIGEAAKTELKKLKDGRKISNASYSSFFRRAKQLYRTGISELLRTFPLKNSLLPYL